MAATITECERYYGVGESGSQSTNGEKETAQFRVAVSQFDAKPLEVCRATHANMPAYNSTHYLNTALKVIDKTAKRVNDKARNYWIVTVTWDKPQASGGSAPTPTDTVNSKNVVVRVTGQETAILTQVAADTAKTPIRNAVGDLYPDPIEKYVYDEVISVDFEALSVNMDLAAASRGKINNAPVTMNIPQGSRTFSRTFAKHTLLLKSIDYQVTVSKSDPTATLWSCGIVLVHRPDTWNKVLPQKGYRWLVSGTKTDYADHPEYLAADGTKLGSGTPIVAMSPVQQYTEANLATLVNGI